MDSRYFNISESVNKNIEQYNKHKNLFIAFDFDDTVFDFYNVGDTFYKVEEVLRRCKNLGLKMILFTAREDEKLEFAVNYCKEHGYEPNYINENPVMKTRKPYYNIFLDDKAGLNEAYQILVLTLNYIENEKI